VLLEQEVRYRLRQNNRIVGYQRVINGKMDFYSSDSFWWSGKEIVHNIKDECTGYKDRNNRFLYEWDILRFKMDPDAESELGVILWDEKTRSFGIRAIESRIFIPFELEGLELFNYRQLELFSYLFINPELQEQLGIRE
jgi:hypothetical protein